MLIKICGLCRPEDAAVAAAAGATHVGVIRVPGATRARPVAVAGAVLDAAPGCRRVGVFVDAAVDRVLEEAAALSLDVAQLHGREPPEAVASLRAGGLEVWKVVKPAVAASLPDLAERYASADLLLLEGTSGRGHGGVGARFDWDEVEAVLARLPAGVRLGVAGGVTPSNVAEAVRRFRPALVDVSSGVESSVGEKDPELVRAFVARARAQAEAMDAMTLEGR